MPFYATHAFHAPLLALSLVVLAAAAAAAKSPAEDQFQAAVFHDGKESLPFRLLAPLNYDAKKQYPVVLFLHGAGERGADNHAQLLHFAAIFAAKENREKYPCFVVAPQCPANQKWCDVDWFAASHIMPEKPAKPLALAIKLLADLEKRYSIDPARRYVMGLSMGGYGTWDALARYPTMFAAGVPICGGADEHTAAAIAKIPVWVFHGANDPAVKPSRARNMVAALRTAGGSPKYSEYPRTGHDSWTAASREPDLLPWLFAQKRPGGKG